MQATFNFTSVLTIIEPIAGAHKVSTKKISDVAYECARFNSIMVTGLMKPAKLKKIEVALLDNGFRLCEIIWYRNAELESNLDVQDVNIIYTK